MKWINTRMRQRARPGFVWESQPGGCGPPGLADGRRGGHSAGEKPPAQGAPRGSPGPARGAPPFCSAASQPRAGVVVFELLICSRAKLEGQGKKGRFFLLLAREARGRARAVLTGIRTQALSVGGELAASSRRKSF